MEETKCRSFACLRGMRKTGTWTIINGYTMAVEHITSFVAMVTGEEFYSEVKGKPLEGFKQEVV